MKFIYLIVFATILVSVKSQEDKIRNFFYRRCTRHSINAGDYDTLIGHWNDLSSYMKYAFNLLPLGKEQFCQEEKAKLSRYVQIVTHDMVPCLPASEKNYLPDFINNSFKEFLDFLCHNRGRDIDNFFSTQGKDCMAALERNNAVDGIGNCFNKIFAPAGSESVKKEELCDDLSVARKCFQVALQEHCPVHPGFNDLNRRFFDSISQPCAGCSLQVTSVVFLLLAFIGTKLFS